MTTQFTRRSFMRRAAFCAAGATTPAWAQWLGERMDALRPRKYVSVAVPVDHEAAVCATVWTYDYSGRDGFVSVNHGYAPGAITLDLSDGSSHVFASSLTGLTLHGASVPYTVRSRDGRIYVQPAIDEALAC